MKYKIIVGGQSAEIEKDEIPKAVEAIQGGGIIVLNHIVFNSSYFEAIVRDTKAEEVAAENRRYGVDDKNVSDFAEILSPKMKMLSSRERDSASVEASSEERKLKTN